MTDADLEEVSPSLRAALTQTGALVGTPLYMSPEQFEGKPADALSDQYSFCVSLYQGLYGQRPFDANSIAALVRNVVGGRVLSPPAETSVPPAVGEVLRRGMSLDPAQRFASMQALIDALEAGRSATAAPARSSRRGLVLGLVALLGVGSAAAFAASSGEDASLAPIGGSDGAASEGPSEGPSDAGPGAEAVDGQTGAGASEPLLAADDSVAGTDTDASSTGDASTDTPSADPTAKAAKRPRDYCFIHEDSYKLLRRGARKQSTVKATDGGCYACRPEKRQNRISRFRYKCGGYYVCSPADAETCR